MRCCAQVGEAFTAVFILFLDFLLSECMDLLLVIYFFLKNLHWLKILASRGQS